MNNYEFIARHAKRLKEGTPLRGQKREARHGSLLATNEALYSYGYHYPLLFPVTKQDGTTVWICNDGGYSVSTSKHIGMARAYADASVPLGGTGYNFRLPTLETCIEALKEKRTNLANTMATKKRKDTQIYRSLLSEWQDLGDTLETLGAHD